MPARSRSEAGRIPKASEKTDKLGDEATNAPIFAALREQVRKKRRGYMAPLKNVDAVEAATKLPFDEGLKREAEIFKECLFSDQSKALIHAFLRRTRGSQDSGCPPRIRPTIDVQKAAVIGAGTMGGGITMTYVNAGIPVRLRETSQEALDRGMATIRKNYQRSVERGRFTQEFVDQRLAMITPRLDYAGFEEADIVVEAVFEGMALKKEVFAEIDKVAKPGAILASNTSTLNIDEIASATSRPESVIGNHFFSPANVMRLLEIVRGEKTSKEVIASCMALARRLRKVGVLVGNCFGFVGNRMFHSYTREAQFLVEEGAPVSLVDKTLYDFGWAMGPLAVGDLAGLDVGYRIRKELPPDYLAAGGAAGASLGPALRIGPLRTENRSRVLQVRRKPRADGRPGSRRSWSPKSPPNTASSSARSANGKSSTGRSSPLPTRARGYSTKGWPCARSISTSSIKTVTASRPTAAARCGLPTT